MARGYGGQNGGSNRLNEVKELVRRAKRTEQSPTEVKCLEVFKSSLSKNEYGRLTEWLGSGLQNRLRRFESATDLRLNNKPADIQRVLFLLVAYLVADCLNLICLIKK